jgi:hypothetical protein
VTWVLESENGIKVWRRSAYRVWCDRDVEYGLWAASVEQPSLVADSHHFSSLHRETIIGHAQTRRGAQRLCSAHEQGCLIVSP